MLSSLMPSRPIAFTLGVGLATATIVGIDYWRRNVAPTPGSQSPWSPDLRPATPRDVSVSPLIYFSIVLRATPKMQISGNYFTRLLGRVARFFSKYYPKRPRDGPSSSDHISIASDASFASTITGQEAPSVADNMSVCDPDIDSDPSHSSQSSSISFLTKDMCLELPSLPLSNSPQASPFPPRGPLRHTIDPAMRVRKAPVKQRAKHAESGAPRGPPPPSTFPPRRPLRSSRYGLRSSISTGNVSPKIEDHLFVQMPVDFDILNAQYLPSRPIHQSDDPSCILRRHISVSSNANSMQCSPSKTSLELGQSRRTSFYPYKSFNDILKASLEHAGL